MADDSVSEELAVQETFLDVSTGEVLPATPQNAAAVIAAARDLKSRCDQAIRDATRILVDESRRQGKKTFEAGGLRIELSGGPKTVYDAADLAEALREAGVPEERIDEAVKQEFTYKIDRAVLKQLAAANPAYAAAIEAAGRVEEDSFKAALK